MIYKVASVFTILYTISEAKRVRSFSPKELKNFSFDSQEDSKGRGGRARGSKGCICTSAVAHILGRGAGGDEDSFSG